MRDQYEPIIKIRTKKVFESKKIVNYILRLVALTNQMKWPGETMIDQVIVEKTLRTLPSQFDHIIVTTEETNELLGDLKVEDLQGTLKAREMKVINRGNERQEKQTLLARFKKGESNKENWKKNKAICEFKDS